MPRAPAFWRADGVASRLLAPLGALYGAFARQRLSAQGLRADLPTIVVGGLTAGGDGKTPLVISLAGMLTARGERPALLTRGFGKRGGRAAPFVFDPMRDDAATAGDEAVLLARHGLTVVGADRAAGAALARDEGASLLILDDGFHSRRLAGDLAFLVVDSDFGAGAGRCLPAGPLRAPLDAQFAAADALIVVGDGAPGKALALRAGKPVFEARLAPDADAARALAGARVVAFAGIGRPDKFFRTLRDIGADAVATKSFPDHHRFGARDIAELTALGRRHGARLVTTEKDAARLSASGLGATAVPVALQFRDRDGVAATLAATLARARLSRAS